MRIREQILKRKVEKLGKVVFTLQPTLGTCLEGLEGEGGGEEL